VLLLDNSAWARLMQGAVAVDRAAEIRGLVERGEIGVCLPFMLEAGYSARSAADRKEIMARLERFPHVTIDSEVERVALHAQRELAEVGHHRLAPTDVVIAACAHNAEAGVLHYDGDYDILAQHTSLIFESEWLAPAGTF
jgi:predicted nucleic acid-binding protein